MGLLVAFPLSDRLKFAEVTNNFMFVTLASLIKPKLVTDWNFLMSLQVSNSGVGQVQLIGSTAAMYFLTSYTGGVKWLGVKTTEFSIAFHASPV